ncbi:hypothetical protein HJB51_01640 [Rhizobium lentis]|uniref:Uncharacterized protein n=2 Tax=Rhizobium lentis TaxID=1138194 RepID=A0A9Q3M7I7_9HYPH|nr:hypothetical protein [Rhizobium lentis]MBX5041853.1 hypothetical protein [Rhizobium lentis]MBX5051403.1 hypothetical protein [Rhizobium lentis]MBX5072712.1 hypothetical protein [Rhizobium lentis]MBX5106715.1 hypothetical protein [Rhizobium lentis]
MCRSPVEIARQHSTRPRQTLSRRTEMSILEIALASQIWARRHERRGLAFDESDGLKVLLRVSFVFVAFTLLIAGLNIAPGRPQMLAQHSAAAVMDR